MLDSILVELAIQGPPINSQDLGSAGVILIQLVENPQNVNPFDFIQRARKRPFRRALTFAGKRNVRRQIRDLQNRRATNRQGTLHRVVQLADIARPRVALEQPHRLR